MPRRRLVTALLCFGGAVGTTLSDYGPALGGFLVSYQCFCTFGTYQPLRLWRWYVPHWCYCFLMYIGLLLVGAIHPSLCGLCFGGIAHGVQGLTWNQLHFDFVAGK